MPAITEIEQELRDATRIKPKAKESRQVFLGRLGVAVQDLSEEGWEKLSKDAQTWSNSCAQAHDKKLEYPDFDADAEEQEAAPPAGKKKPAAKAAPAAKAGAKAKPAAESTGRVSGELKEGGVKVQIKKLILKKPSISAEEIVEALSKRGDTPSKFTVASIRAEFRHSLKVLKMEGMLEIDI